MKYGIILHNYGSSAKKEGGFNIGDPMQSIALEKIYYEMGIKDSEIKRINLCDLKTYTGEYILLPMLGVAIGINFASFPLSSKIIPIFISAHFATSELNFETISYLRSFSPIGCRDEFTLNTMRRYGIPAYLSGCITVIFKKRETRASQNKVFLIDIPPSLEENIPKGILKDAIRETHLLPLTNEYMDEDEAQNMYELSKSRLDYYKMHAKLIVSSRMHALVPCMAMGIPVIAVFENISYRFSWLDKYVDLHTEDMFQDIIWDPAPIEFENEKLEIKSHIITVIENNYKKYKDMYEISEFYEMRQRAAYGNHYHNALKPLSLKPPKFSYIIWGCGLIGNTVYDIMSQLFPSAQLMVAVDEYVEGFWHDVPIIKSEQLYKYSDCFLIIATCSGKTQAYNVMKKLNRKESEDFAYLGTING